MDRDVQIAQLRARREQVQAFELALSTIRATEASLAELKSFLTAELKKQRAERAKDVRAANRAGVPKTHISREVGLNRATLYQTLEEDD